MSPKKSLQRGAALIMALLVVALATALASNLIWRQDLWLRQLETQRDLAQARLLVSAGIDWSRAVLAEDARTSHYDHKGEPWNTKVPAMPAEGGEVAGALADEQGKLNLNNLLRDGQISQDDVVVFRHLLTQLQLPTSLAGALADWIDSDSKTTSDGAEDPEYQALKPPYRAANRELSDIDNLLRVRGFEPGSIERLRPYVSALPGYNRININTASTIVISAVLHDFPPADIQQIVADRDRIPYIDLADFRKRLSRPDLAALPSVQRLDTRTSYFTASIHARYGNVETASSALLFRQNAWPTIVWRKSE